jgi:hypothetical protein
METATSRGGAHIQAECGSNTHWCASAVHGFRTLSGHCESHCALRERIKTSDPVRQALLGLMPSHTRDRDGGNPSRRRNADPHAALCSSHATGQVQTPKVAVFSLGADLGHVKSLKVGSDSICDNEHPSKYVSLTPAPRVALQKGARQGPGGWAGDTKGLSYGIIHSLR